MNLFALSIVKIKFALSFGRNWLRAVITYYVTIHEPPINVILQRMYVEH